MKIQNFDIVSNFVESSQFGWNGNTWLRLEVSIPETKDDIEEEGYGPLMKLIAGGRQNADFTTQLNFSQITPKGCDLFIKQLKEVKKFLKQNTKAIN